MRTTGAGITIVLLMLLIMQSCDPNMVYDKFKETDEGSWSWDEPIMFEVDITDTVSDHNVYLNIRHTKEYQKTNLYTFLSLTGPSGAVINDTIEFTIARPNGKWLGTGFGNIKLVRKLYREAVRFALPGTYVFTIEQGMRLEEVPVTDVGLRIEKYRKLK